MFSNFIIRRITLCFFILITINTFAQEDFQGKAYYQSKTPVDMSIFGRPGMSEDVKKRIAERMKRMFEKTYILTFNKIESTYKVEEELAAPSQGGGGRFGSMMSGAINGNEYKNIQTNQFLIEHELFGKQFLVKDELPKLEWKMTGETKQIGKYTCFKATAIKTWKDFEITNFRRPPAKEEQDTASTENQEETIVEEPKTEIIAWYTMQIPVNLGPGAYSGLPGLILEINDDKTTILCSKIVLNPNEKSKIKIPSKGKEVTKKEYVEIATKKLEEMRANWRRGGRSGGGRR